MPSPLMVPARSTVLVPPSPAAFPSVLKTSGRSLADANGHVMPRLKGLVMQPIGQVSSWYTDAYNEGARIIRTVVFWDKLQPTGPPSSGTDFSGIDTTTYVPNSLDTHIQNCVNAGLYVVFTFYFSPQSTHSPGWSLGTSVMTNYVTYGQAATNYLAQRYGDPADPLGAGKYTPAVIGMGINEITPDSTTGAGWLNTLIGQQATYMMGWMRTYAPNWIACISCGFGASAPVPNAAGSGHTTDQTFTGVDHTLLDAAGGNYVMEMHDYLVASTDGSDSRGASGTVNNSLKIAANDTTNSGGNNYTTYPPVVSGTTLTRATCQTDHSQYLAPYVAYCTANNVPLMIGEFGWAPLNGSTTFTGGPDLITDKMKAWAAAGPAGPVIAIEWDYQKTQSSDPWAAEPGSSASGADANGWQTVTNNFFASF